jgi:hypothetical protein
MTTNPLHFEILTKQSGNLASETTFATYDEAVDWLTADPLISANPNHPYFWDNLFEIALCGGDGCTL